MSASYYILLFAGVQLDLTDSLLQDENAILRDSFAKFHPELFLIYNTHCATGRELLHKNQFNSK